MSGPEQILDDYFRLMNLNSAAQVYHEAVRLGLLDALRNGPQAAAEVAAKCGTVARPTELVLECLATLGVVICREDKFTLTMLGQMLLAGNYRNLGNEYWSHLPKLLRTGEPLPVQRTPAENEAFYQAQAAVLGWMLGPSAAFAAEALQAITPPDAKILDVGAGSAVWSLTLAARLPGATVTAVDFPGVLEVTREAAAERELAERLTTIAGDYHQVTLPSAAFDLAIVANVTHLETPDGNRRLLAKIAAAVKPSGRIAIIDVFPGQERGDLNRTLYTIGLALRSERGRVYSAAELQEFLAAAGFGSTRLIPIETAPFAVGILLASR